MDIAFQAAIAAPFDLRGHGRVAYLCRGCAHLSPRSGTEFRPHGQKLPPLQGLGVTVGAPWLQIQGGGYTRSVGRGGQRQSEAVRVIAVYALTILGRCG